MQNNTLLRASDVFHHGGHFLIFVLFFFASYNNLEYLNDGHFGIRSMDRNLKIFFSPPTLIFFVHFWAFFWPSTFHYTLIS